MKIMSRSYPSGAPLPHVNCNLKCEVPARVLAGRERHIAAKRANIARTSRTTIPTESDGLQDQGRRDRRLLPYMPALGRYQPHSVLSYCMQLQLAVHHHSQQAALSRSQAMDACGHSYCGLLDVRQCQGIIIQHTMHETGKVELAGRTPAVYDAG